MTDLSAISPLVPDGQTFASTSDGWATVKLWTLEGRLLQTFAGHQVSCS